MCELESRASELLDVLLDVGNLVKKDGSVTVARIYEIVRERGIPLSSWAQMEETLVSCGLFGREGGSFVWLGGDDGVGKEA